MDSFARFMAVVWGDAMDGVGRALRQFGVIYAAAVLAFVPWAFAMAREDGAEGEPMRILAYATLGSILPALLAMMFSRWSKSLWWGAAAAVAIGFFAWRGA